MDIQLVLRQIADGNREAFTEIVEAFQRPLFRYLGHMGLPASLAEEIAQETFLRVWQHLPQFDARRASFQTWLFTIGRRLAFNELQRASYRLETHHADDTHEAMSPAPGPEEHEEQLARLKQLQKAMSQLSPQDRSLLALAHGQDLSLKTIAHIEGCTETAAKVRLHRARKRLNQQLGESNAQTR